MKRLPVLEKLLTKIYYPQIEIFNHATIISSPLYFEDIEIPIKDTSEIFIDTLIKFNGFSFTQNYNDFLYNLKENVLNEINNYCIEKSKTEIKKYLATIYFNLPPIKDFYTQIKCSYKIVEISKEMEPVLKENDVTILLEKKHDDLIHSFNEISFKFYLEVFNTYKKFYEHYHDRFSIKILAHEESYSQNGIESFSFSKNIPEKNYQRIFFYLNDRLIKSNPEMFLNAFSGKTVSKPFEIKWLLEFHGNANKRALIFFLQSELFEHEINDHTFLAKIKNTFTDKNGKALGPRLDENLRQFNKVRNKFENSNSVWKRQIDNIVKQILT